MITTAGFRDLVEIGRQVRPSIYDLKADAPLPLACRRARFEVAERIGSTGEVLVSLTDKEIDRVVDLVASADVDCCAVCLLFSFLNAEHELRIGEALRSRLPELHLSLSSAVQPEFREYERFSTTILNAFLQPKVTRYMERLEAALAQTAGAATIGISQSSGGPHGNRSRLRAADQDGPLGTRRGRGWRRRGGGALGRNEPHYARHRRAPAPTSASSRAVPPR